ncbi:MAG: hypothetical protein NTX65_11090 [Ignavibacteriales bacterium]|nr:hypothetical protein [Ignavibacteriales bacterium]
MKNYKPILMLVIGVVLFSSCNTENPVITKIPGINDFSENNPSVANALNSLTITVVANKYNYALEYTINFDKLNADLALSIGGRTGGDVSIQIYNDSKQMLYNADFNQNTSYAQSIIFDEKPTKVKLIFNTLTANFSCALSGK